MTPGQTAAALLERIDSERMVSAGPDGVTYDHPGAEAVLCITGALDLIGADDGAAMLVLDAVAWALDATPLGAPAGSLHTEFDRRVRTLTRGRCGRNALRVVER